MANLTLYNVAICVVVAIGGFTYGFAFAAFVTTIGEPGFFRDFDLDPLSSYTATILGAVNALFLLGAACGAIIQGWAADWLGRKKALAVAAACSLVGGALQTGSVNVTMIIIVRILQGFGLGMIICLVPLYTTEVAPAHRRGLLSGMTVMGFGSGYTFDAYVSLATYYAPDLTVQWRLPLGIACVGPIVLLIGLPFIPESPRYLSWIGKNEEAWKVIQRLHHDPSDPTESSARAEFIQVFRQVEADKEQKAGYIQMFTKPSWRKRSILAMSLMFATQCSGIFGITTYLIPVAQTLGMTGVMPLVIYVVYSTVGTTCVFICCFTVDRIGRRKVFLIGFPCLAACLLGEALLQWRYLGTDDKAGNAACLLFMFLFIICFQFVDAPSFIWAAEIFPTTIRAKGLGVTLFAYFVGAITWSTPGALAFQNIKWRMYLVWCALCILSTIFVFFFIPETKRVPVEEIGALFGDVVVVHLTEDGRGIVENDEKFNAMALGDDHHESDTVVVGDKALVTHHENAAV